MSFFYSYFLPVLHHRCHLSSLLKSCIIRNGRSNTSFRRLHDHWGLHYTNNNNEAPTNAHNVVPLLHVFPSRYHQGSISSLVYSKLGCTTIIEVVGIFCRQHNNSSGNRALKITNKRLQCRL